LTDDFGYLNARIRVRQSQMLPEGFFSEALTLGFPGLVKILAETIYGPDLTGDDLAAVDRAVLVHLHRTVGDLPRLVAGQAREAVSLLLLRADLANVKIILRGLEAGWSKEEILGHLEAGTIPRALYDVLAEAPDAAALAQLLTLPGHPLARALRRASSAARDPLDLEITMDREFYKAVLSRAEDLDQPYLASFMRFEIDAVNLATGLKLSIMGITAELARFFLPGGRRINQSLFELLATGEMGVLEQLENTDFEPVAGVKDLTGLEHGLRCLLLAKAREGVKDVLGAGMAINYILHKEWEASRIRLLARRSFYDLPPETIEEEVFCR
jgi:V/A-type H+/Na+-transporting ATPase subunit C